MIQNKNIKEQNTFGIDAVASYYAEFYDLDQLEDILEQADGHRLYVLGGGSNTLFNGDFDGVLIHPVNDEIEIIGTDGDDVLIVAEAGVEWDEFVRYTVENGYFGAENLSFIPGSVGASPVQNIGAYGSEAKDIIESVTFYDITKRSVSTLTAQECNFGYRDSIFKNELQSKIVVLSVLFRLHKTFIPNVHYGNIINELDSSQKLTAKIIRDTIIRIRKDKLPDPKLIGNGGSFFKNPIISVEKYEELKLKYPAMPSYEDKKGVKIPAGWLIDTAGWKGYREGNVGVHKNQALVLVNYGGGTGQDVMLLANKIISDVECKFGITLHPEINIL